MGEFFDMQWEGVLCMNCGVALPSNDLDCPCYCSGGCFDEFCGNSELSDEERAYLKSFLVIKEKKCTGE